MKFILLVPVMLFALTCWTLASTQGNNPSISVKVLSFPDKLLVHIQKKSDRFEERLTTQTEKYLQSLAKQEHRLQKKLAKTDCVKAKELFSNSQAQYQQLNNTSGKVRRFNNVYSGHFDSMQAALHFLIKNKLNRILLQSLQETNGYDLARSEWPNDKDHLIFF